MPTPSIEQFDALKEIVNIGVGRASSSLNEMLDAHIELKIPSVTFFALHDRQKIPKHLQARQLSCVQMGFAGSFNGVSALMFPPESAAKLVTALTGEDPGTPGMNAVMAGTLNEVGNILLNGVMGTIGNILEKPFDYSFPNYLEGTLEELLAAPDIDNDALILMIETNFEVRELQIEGNVFLLFEMNAFEKLVVSLSELYERG